MTRFLRGELHGPTAYDLGRVGERSLQSGNVERVGGVQRPKSAKLQGEFSLRVVRLTVQRCERPGVERARGGAFLQQAAGGPNVPFAAVTVELGQLKVGASGEVDLGGAVVGSPGNAVNAAVGAIPDFGARVVTVLGVAPVDNIDCAVGSVLQIDGQVRRVGRERYILARVESLIGGAGANVDLLIDLVAVEIVGEEVIAIGFRPVVAEIDHGADVRVAAVNSSRARLARSAFAAVVASGSHQEVLQLRREIWAAI